MGKKKKTLYEPTAVKQDPFLKERKTKRGGGRERGPGSKRR